jgi:hypothetical protein
METTMSDEIKNSVVLRGLLDDRNQALRIATAEELLAKADLHRAEAKFQNVVADRLKAQALVTMMEAEIYDAEKREFCDEAEAEISAREAAEAKGLKRSFNRAWKMECIDAEHNIAAFNTAYEA